MDPRLKELTEDEQKENLSYIFYFVLASISFLFIGLTGAYVFQILFFGGEAISLHWGFYLATLLIISVSFLANQAGTAIDRSDKKRLHTLWIVCIGFLLLFLCAQIYSWLTLFESFQDKLHVGQQYLYLISVVHALHIIAGLPFHISLLIRFNKRANSSDVMKDNILMHRFKILIKYWHYLDILWILLMIIFYIMTLI